MTEKNHLSPHAILKIKNTKVNMRERVSRYSQKYNGIYLDVFPLDNPPDTLEKQKKQANKIKKIKRIIDIKAGYEYSDTSNVKKVIKRLMQVVLTPLSFTFLNKKLDNCMKEYSLKNGKNLVSMASHYSYWKQLMPAEIYGKPKCVVFENKEYNAPSEVNEYLVRIYGDYMKLPSGNNLYSILDHIVNVEYSINEGIADD